MFDECQERGENLLELGYGDQETFSRDDMIDAFMKGCSEMCRELGFENGQKLTLG